jgi:hypothetical protein
MSLAFFVGSSLDLLGAMDTISLAEKAEYIDWIYAQQHPEGGFRGSPFIGLPVSSDIAAEIKSTEAKMLSSKLSKNPLISS